MSMSLVMASILQRDLQTRGHEFPLGDCEAMIARMMDVVVTLEARRQIRAEQRGEQLTTCHRLEER